ncbi:MAG: hypothetical protein IJE78_06170 [Bacteroidaceae bacterium]|nr:hypothetical protein [Bacteroidaceae bacterium]
MVALYILVIISLLLNIYCIINIFQSASASQAQLNLCKLRGMQIEELQKEIQVWKSHASPLQKIQDEVSEDDK